MKKRLYDLLWLLTAAGALTAFFLFLAHEAGDRPLEEPLRVAMIVALVVAVAGLAAEARYDVYAACVFAVPAGLLLAIVGGAVVAVGVQPHPHVLAVACLGGVLMVAAFIYLAWTELAPGRFPDVLRTQYGRLRLYEEEGVQFVLWSSSGQVEAGAAIELCVVAQNCWDAERTLHVEQRAPETTGDAGLSFPAVSLVLAPSAVMALGVPVVAGPRAAGRSFNLRPAFRVTGSGGARVRRRRAPPFEQVSEPMRALGLLSGVIVWGGYITIAVLPTRDRTGGGSAPRETRRSVVWLPSPEQGRQLVR